MISGVTESGFEFELEEDVLDDYELLETLCELDKGNYSVLADMVNMLLTEEQKIKLKEHVKKDGKRVSTKRLLTEVMQIFNATKELKN